MFNSVHHSALIETVNCDLVVAAWVKIFLHCYYASSCVNWLAAISYLYRCHKITQIFYQWISLFVCYWFLLLLFLWSELIILFAYLFRFVHINNQMGIYYNLLIIDFVFFIIKSKMQTIIFPYDQKWESVEFKSP